MADMRSCYEASVATRGAETQIFINENEHTGCEGNVLQRDSWTGMWGSLPAIFHIVYNCGTLTRIFALSKKISDDIIFYLYGITRKTKLSQPMRDYFKKVVYFPGSSNNCATVVKYSGRVFFSWSWSYWWSFVFDIFLLNDLWQKLRGSTRYVWQQKTEGDFFPPEVSRICLYI